MDIKSDFTCDPYNFELTSDMLKAYNELGYFLVRGFLSEPEVVKIKQAVERDQFVHQGYPLEDHDRKKYNLIMWKHPGHDVTGMLARCHKLAGTCQKILGEEVYHYHTKLVCKAPKEGGQLLWHQDYGYWYKNGCLRPDIASAFIPIDRCVKESGCLQILERSHLCGRIDHVMTAGQTGADVERVEHLKAVCPHKYVEMEAGDALFFHANLLHTSSANVSDHKRWALIPAYNTRSNNPVYQHHHPQYTPLEMVPDSSILSCENFDDLSGKEFNVPSEDKTVTVRTTQ